MMLKPQHLLLVIPVSLSEICSTVLWADALKQVPSSPQFFKFAFHFKMIPLGFRRKNHVWNLRMGLE